jgi:hypothetical protein
MHGRHPEFAHADKPLAGPEKPPKVAKLNGVQETLQMIRILSGLGGARPQLFLQVLA